MSVCFFSGLHVVLHMVSRKMRVSRSARAQKWYMGIVLTRITTSDDICAIELFRWAG
jgi:hypothetical protein